MPRTRSIAWSELKVGVVSLIAMSLVVVLVVAVGGQGGFFWQRYPLKASFVEINGLKTGAVVRLNGKEVGRVSDIQFVGPRIEVAVVVSKDVRPLITDLSTASIGSLSLLGEPIVDITAATEGEPLGDWAYLPTTEAGGPLGKLSASATAGLDQASDLFRDLRAGRGTMGKLITDDTLYRELTQFVTAADQVTRQLQAGKGTIGELLKDPATARSLRASIDNLQTMTARINSGQGTLGKLVNDDTLSKSLQSTMSNADEVTGRMARGEGTMGKLLTDKQLYDRMNQLTARVDSLVSNLDAGKGTVGQLLKDQALYDNLNKAATELRSLLTDIRKDPKKFLRVSISIF